MKKLLFTLSTLLFLSVTAQELKIPERLDITEVGMSLRNQSRNGFKSKISGEDKDIIKQFSKYLSDQFDIKTKSKSGILAGEKLMNASISQKHFDLTAYIQTIGEGKELRLFLNFGPDIYVSSKDYVAEATKAKSILKDFAKTYYQNYVNETIKKTTKDVKKSDKNLAKVNKTIAKEQKAKAKSEGKILKLQAKIKKTEAKIVKSQEDIKKMEASTIDQRSEIEKIDANNIELNKSKEEATTKLNESRSYLEKLKTKLGKIANY